MKTIIHLEDTKISPLIFLSSSAIMTDTADPFDSHYQFETTLLSKDDRIKSRNFKWGSSTDYYLSFRLFHVTSWVHKRIVKRLRCHLKKLNGKR